MNTALHKKLRLHKYTSVGLVSQVTTTVSMDGLPRFNTVEEARNAQLLIVFVADLPEMARVVSAAYQQPELQALYLVYPKRGNPLGLSAIGRDDIFPFLQVNEADGVVKDTDLRFNLMVSLDENFTVVGLKRNALSNKRKTASAANIDPMEGLRQMENLLHTSPALPLFQALTPGYRRQWTEHILSAKTCATRQKRLSELENNLLAGFKNKDKR